jgi:hypothetical protein
LISGSRAFLPKKGFSCRVKLIENGPHVEETSTILCRDIILVPIKVKMRMGLNTSTNILTNIPNQSN